MNTSNYKNFPELLIANSRLYADKNALIVLDDAGEETNKITYGALIERINYYALQISQHCSKGDRGIILLPPGIDFVVAYLSCLFAGVVAVPSNLPGRNKKNSRFRQVIKDADPSIILLDENVKDLIDRHFSDYEELKKVQQILTGDKSSRDEFLPDSNKWDTAYLQYTSGSTGKPKGVMVTHDNLMQNSEVIRQAFNHTTDLIVMNWLPPFHDMGLVGNLLQPLYLGGTSVIMSPAAFLKSPFIWLEAIGKYGATTTGCPNFALDYCTEKVSDEQKMKIDLSSIKVFYCGSEPIRKESFENFISSFSGCGFNPQKLLPCYGLAESTLMVTGISAKEKPLYLNINKASFENDGVALINSTDEEGINMVSCGYAWNKNKVVIADPGSLEQLPENTLGEILVHGTSVAKGYFRDEVETKRVFEARTKMPSEGPFLRTGDLGFMHNGHLFISGRRKDLIIIRGVNHHPHQIEHTVENCHPDLQSNACAAFSVQEEGEEKLVVIQEIKRIAFRSFDREEIIKAIRTAIAEEHEIATFAIALISPGSMPKTTSGKIKRAECRILWSMNELRSLALWRQEKIANLSMSRKEFSIDDLTKWLVLWLSRKTGTKPEDIDLSKPILSYGLDSINAVELERELNAEFGISISLVDVLANKSIHEMLHSDQKNKS